MKALKIAPYILAGACLLYSPKYSECGSRKELGIPEVRLDQCIGRAYGSNKPGQTYRMMEYDTDGDGRADFYMLRFTDHKTGHMAEFAWLDRNGNLLPDLGEVYVSPDADEDWEVWIPGESEI
jgi:hypothetical protein